MRFKIFLLIFLLSGQGVRAKQNSAVDFSNSVRVRVQKEITEIYLSGVAVQFSEAPTPFQKVAIPAIHQWQITRVPFQKSTAWKVVDTKDGTQRVLKSPYINITGRELRIGGKPMPSHILLSANALNMDVVAFVPLEEYVVGVVGSEVSASWPIETLKAQAVATRSYTMAVMKERAKKLFHVESDVSDQVYHHIFQSDTLRTSEVAKVSQAVVETESQVLRDKNFSVVKAFYHADCGGQTLDARKVGLGKVSFGVAKDPWCATNKKNRWSVSLSPSELVSRLRGTLAFQGSVISGLQTVLDRDSHNVDRIEVKSEVGPQVFSSYDLRKSIGWKNMKSTRFSVKNTGNGDFTFEGQGYGHGVGLCQTGSQYLGKQGKSYSEILSHYYPLASLGKVLPQVKN